MLFFFLFFLFQGRLCCTVACASRRKQTTQKFRQLENNGGCFACFDRSLDRIYDSLFTPVQLGKTEIERNRPQPMKMQPDCCRAPLTDRTQHEPANHCRETHTHSLSLSLCVCEITTITTKKKRGFLYAVEEKKKTFWALGPFSVPIPKMGNDWRIHFFVFPDFSPTFRVVLMRFRKSNENRKIPHLTQTHRRWGS